jgi:hypothetical protein
MQRDVSSALFAWLRRFAPFRSQCFSGWQYCCQDVALLLDIDVVCDVEDRRCPLSMPSTVLLIRIGRALYSVGYISARIRSTVGGSVRGRRFAGPAAAGSGLAASPTPPRGEGRGEATGALVGSSLLSSARVRPRSEVFGSVPRGRLWTGRARRTRIPSTEVEGPRFD